MTNAVSNRLFSIETDDLNLKDRIVSPRMLAIRYLIFASVVVLLMCLIVPPFAAPDEMVHMLRAASLASGQVLPVTGPERVVGGKADAAAIEFDRIFEPTARNAAPMPAEVAVKARQLAWAHKPEWTLLPGTAPYGPALYLPQATGLFLGRSIGLSVMRTYQFTRILTALTAIGLASIAIAAADRGVFVLAVVLLTPQFLFLAASLSQDGLLIAVSALFAVLVSKPQSSDGNERNWIAWICALIMAMGRPPMVLLSVLLIRKRKNRSIGRWLRSPDGPLAPILILCVVLAWCIVVRVPAQPVLKEAPAGTDPPAQLSALLKHPSSIVHIAIGTMENNEFTRVSRGVIGVLGWGKITLPWSSHVLGQFVILLAALTCLLGPPGRSLVHNWTAAVVFALLIGEMYAYFYLSWSPVGAQFVTGFQGRYLLPLLVDLPLIIPSPGSSWFRTKKSLGRKAGFFACGVMVAITVQAVLTLRAVYSGAANPQRRAEPSSRKPDEILPGLPIVGSPLVRLTCLANIDLVNGYLFSAAKNLQVVNGTLLVQGWTAMGPGIPSDSVFVTLSKNGQTLYVTTRSVPRPDVNTVLPRPDLPHLGPIPLRGLYEYLGFPVGADPDFGFISRVNVSSLEGDYRLGLARMYKGKLEACQQFEEMAVDKQIIIVR